MFVCTSMRGCGCDSGFCARVCVHVCARICVCIYSFKNYIMMKRITFLSLNLT